MKLGKHISDLLYHHESVLLPGFGTFSTHYVPARFIPEKKIVESPAKRASFSPEPKEGPSPLPDYMAEREGKSPEEVRAFLRDVVGEIQMSLEKGKQVELEQLGRLTLDEQGAFLFQPDPGINFLEDAPDIPAVATSGPASRDGSPDAEAALSEYEHAEQQLPHTKPDTHKTMEEQKPTLHPALKWTAIIVVPLLLIGLLVYLSFNMLTDDGRFFWQPAPTVVETVDEAVETPEEPDLITDQPDPDEIAEEHVPEREVHVTDPLRPEPGRKAYYLVVGSFRNEVKAERLAENLRREGAERAHVLPETPSRYYRVCYGFYYDISEAERKKAALHDDLQKAAWILHR